MKKNERCDGVSKQRKYQQFTQTNVLYKLNMKIDEFVRNGSGRVLHHLECIYFGVLKYNPLKLLSFIELPKDISRRNLK